MARYCAEKGCDTALLEEPGEWCKAHDYMTLEVPFQVTIPRTSEKNARKLMREVVGMLEGELDNADSLFESYEAIYAKKLGIEEEEVEAEYSFGFGLVKIV